MGPLQRLARRAIAVILATAILPNAALAQTVPVQIPMSNLTGVTWTWLRSDYNDGSSVVAADPTRYTLEFHSDATITLGADCNRVTGTYSQQAGRLAVRLGATTLAACPPDSQADTFVADLARVASYTTDGANLVLHLDNGNMVLEPQSSAALLDVTWQLRSLNTGQAITNPLPTPQITIRFDANGGVAGSSGCNTYRGNVTVDGNALTFGPLATTRMACPAPILDQEAAYLRALERTRTFSVTNSQLTLFDATGVIQAEFTPAVTGMPPGMRPFPTDVPWRITSYNNGRDAVVTVVPGTEAGATFRADGSVTGMTGCNTFVGTYTTSGSSIALGPLETTRRACPSEDASAQEQAILAAFGAAASFELLGDRMTLRSADGATQMELLRPLNGVTPG